jgi:hypothetical protein
MSDIPQHSLSKEKDGHYYLMVGDQQAECPYSGIMMAQDQLGQPRPIRFPCSSRCALFQITSINNGHSDVRLHCSVSYRQFTCEIKNTSTIQKA